MDPQLGIALRFLCCAQISPPGLDAPATRMRILGQSLLRSTECPSVPNAVTINEAYSTASLFPINGL